MAGFAIVLPTELTREEEYLLKKYVKLREKRQQLLENTRGDDSVEDSNLRRKSGAVTEPLSSETLEEAKEQAKKLLKSGVIKLEADKVKGVRRPSTSLEQKRLEPRKRPAAHDLNLNMSTVTSSSPPRQGVGDVALSEGDRSNFASSQPYQPPPVQKSRTIGRRYNLGGGPLRKDAKFFTPNPTVFVRGQKPLDESVLKRFFEEAACGAVLRCSLSSNPLQAFVAFASIEEAENAIRECNHSLLGTDNMIQVEFARPQRSFDDPGGRMEAAADNLGQSWLKRKQIRHPNPTETGPSPDVENDGEGLQEPPRLQHHLPPSQPPLSDRSSRELVSYADDPFGGDP